MPETGRQWPRNSQVVVSDHIPLWKILNRAMFSCSFHFPLFPAQFAFLAPLLN
jgi:hypothetical protein